MPDARTGRIAHVDLTRGVVEIETPPESFYRKYFGGSAMGMYYILKQTQPGHRPARARERPDHVGQPADRGADLRAEPHVRQRPLAARRRHRGRAVRRLLPGRDALRRLRRPGDHRARRPRRVYLWLHDGAGRAAAGRAPVGQDDVAGGRCAQGRAGRRQDRDRPVRAGGREARPAGRDHQHGQPRQRPHRAGRRHGLQEPQGRRRTRHEQEARLGRRPAHQRDGQGGRSGGRRTTATSSGCRSTAPPASSPSSTSAARCRPSTTTPGSSSTSSACRARR